MIGFFQEAIGVSSMTRLTTFIAFLVGCGILIAEVVKHIITPTFIVEWTSITVFLGTFGAMKLIQKGQEITAAKNTLKG